MLFVWFQDQNRYTSIYLVLLCWYMKFQKEDLKLFGMGGEHALWYALISHTCKPYLFQHSISTAEFVVCVFFQLSQSPMDKRPSYDAIQGANVNPTTFYNIGDLEIQDNLARIWYGFCF